MIFFFGVGVCGGVEGVGGGGGGVGVGGGGGGVGVGGGGGGVGVGGAGVGCGVYVCVCVWGGGALPPIATRECAAPQGRFWKASFPKIGCDFLKFP